MRSSLRFTAIGVLAAALIFALGASPGMAQPRAHVYLLRGLMNIFSLGMDTLAGELNKRGVYATVDNHSGWQGLADGAAARYKSGSDGPIILIGHSLGADAVMEMANYLGQKGVPVALVVPFDGTQSFYATSNVARVLNLTQRDYAYMRRGPGFHGTLVNVDLSGDPQIDHLTIDKSPKLHARVISEVLAVIGSHRGTEPGGPDSTRASASPANGAEVGAKAGDQAKSAATKSGEAASAPAPAPIKTGDSAATATPVKPAADGGTPVIALPEHGTAHASSNAAVPHQSAATAQP
ncbi:MAG: thioesterase domain-containing protein [Xanthobacteraceae bacterium]|jgi:hypothetical protein